MIETAKTTIKTKSDKIEHNLLLLIHRINIVVIMVLEKIQKAIVSTLRSSGQALDVVGRTLETNSYVEKCK